MIFVTVGSMFPFDRLIKAIDEQVAAGQIVEEVVAQIGSGSYEPQSIKFERFMEKAEFESLLGAADVVVSHAGIGSIATALNLGKPMLVLPRLKRYGEHVNDHQVATARKYQELGHVMVADEETDLPHMLTRIREFTPVPRHINVEGLVNRIGRYLSTIG